MCVLMCEQASDHRLASLSRMVERGRRSCSATPCSSTADTRRLQGMDYGGVQSNSGQFKFMLVQYGNTLDLGAQHPGNDRQRGLSILTVPTTQRALRVRGSRSRFRLVQP